MNGFNRTPGATAHPMTARNLMGQIDGTNNPKPADPDFDTADLRPGGPAPPTRWMAGGSYAVVRRIRMLLDDWDQLSAGRAGAGDRAPQVRRRAAVSGGTETTAMELDKIGADGELGHPGQRARPGRRAPTRTAARPCCAGRSPTTTASAPTGRPDAGLLFVCWQADPLRGFVPVQRKLDRGDALSRVHPARVERPVRGAGRRARTGSTWGSGCWRGEDSPRPHSRGGEPPETRGYRSAGH